MAVTPEVFDSQREGGLPQLRRVWDKSLTFFSSYGLATLLFLLLLLLTYLGTLEQVEHGLFATQQKYFESIYLIHHFGPIPVVLPGAYLLLILLFINILAGGILRMRRGWIQAGVLISHGGILLLLLGGFVTHTYSIGGHMTLYEGEQSSVIKSYNEWEVALTGIHQDGTRTNVVVPEERFRGLQSGQSHTFRNAALPVELVLSDFAENSVPQRAMSGHGRSRVVDGITLKQLDMDRERERNVAGMYATLREVETGREREAVLWGLQQVPASFTVGTDRWVVDLRRKEWPVPFTIHLDKFTRDLYPGTNMPRAFMSDVTKVENGVAQQIKISMNAPLRHHGYTFYQASWGPQDAGPNDPLFSSFAVSRNPADQWPLYACIIITVGMLLHFSLKLRTYLRREMRRA